MTDAVERVFVGLPSPVIGRAGAGGHPCQGVYHLPARARPTTAFIATHYNVDFSEHYLAEYLAARGYGFLGWNTRFRGAEAYFLLDHALAEIAVGVQWLRDQGIERVVLLGNSGGGSLMSAYHSQGVEPNIRPAARAHRRRGRADVAGRRPVRVRRRPSRAGRRSSPTGWTRRSPTRPTSRRSTRRSTRSTRRTDRRTSAEFVARYREAQRARNARITAWCHAELDRLEEHGLHDRLFTMARTWADLRMIDGALDPSDRRTPWCYLGDPKRANSGAFGIGAVSTCRTWLNMWSLTDSDCGAATHLARLDVPTLLVQPSADNGVFPSQAQEIFDGIAAKDKQFETIDGDHYFQQPDGGARRRSPTSSQRGSANGPEPR